MVPLPGTGDAHSRPPCASTIVVLIDSPIPMPPGLVVKNGSNMCSALSGASPVPESWTATSTASPSRRVVIALQRLALPTSTRLVLGLVHYTDGVDGSRKRMAVAWRYARPFDVATECGFGRRDPATIPELLRIHRELCR